MFNSIFLVILSFIIPLSQLLYTTTGSGNLILSKASDPLGNDISGDKQTGVVKTSLKNPIIVYVTDNNGKPVKGVAIKFKVLNDEKARCIPQIAYTDINGYAKIKVKPGGRTGEFLLEAHLLKNPAKRLIFTYHIFTKKWLLILIIQVIGGFSLFFFGFRVAGKGLTKSAGGGLREIIFRFTQNRISGLFSGIITAFLLQSSTAATVMLVGFISAGLITFMNAAPVILGTAIGTTLSVQLIAFKIYNYSLLIIVIGFILNSLKKPLRYYGQFILGFGLMFLGIKFMADAFTPLSNSGALEHFFVTFGTHPYLVFFIAAIFTASVHSSAATIAIVISLSFQGIIGLVNALPVILGANLGTSATALLASIRGSRESKMCAVENFIFKLITVLIFLPFTGFWTGVLQKTALSTARQIANAHTIFNIVLASIFLPVIKPFGKLLDKIVPEEEKSLMKGPRYLDKGLLNNPPAAIAHTHREILRMADIVYEMFVRTIDVFRNNDKDLMRDIIKRDDEVDTLEEAINDYLTNISQEELTVYQSRRVASLFFVTDELEHIGDVISKSLMVYARKKIQEGFIFSETGFKEIVDFHSMISKNFSIAISALTTFDKELALRLKEERDVGVNIHIKLHNAHIERLKKGLVESIETSTIHLDFIDDLERINFHISNVGYAILGKTSPKL